MRLYEYWITFIDDEFELIYSDDQEKAVILAQARRIEADKDYEVLDIKMHNTRYWEPE